LAARDGTLWINTSKGLASWKNGKLTRYQELAGFSGTPLLEDHQGSIWAAGQTGPDGKLCKIRSGMVQCQDMKGDQRVLGLHGDGKGNLWVGVFAGVWRWSPGRPEFYPLPREPNGVQGFADSEDGGVLVSAADGIRHLLDGKSELAFPLPASVRGLA